MKQVKFVFFLLTILFVSVNILNAGWIIEPLRKVELKEDKRQSNITIKNSDELKLINKHLSKPDSVKKTAVKSVKSKSVRLKKYVKPASEIKKMPKLVEIKYNEKIISDGVGYINFAK